MSVTRILNSVSFSDTSQANGNWMIWRFRDRVTEAVFDGRCPKGFPSNLFKTARRKLGYVDAAERLEVLRIPPENMLEFLHGDRRGQHSIRITDQFRITFRWAGDGPDDVEIVDHHGLGAAMTDTLDIVATLPPLHPGEVLREEFLAPLGLSAGRLAKACAVPRTRIERIATEQLGISGDTALRLGRVLGTGPELWMNLQVRFDMETAKRALGDRLSALPILNGVAA